MTCSTKYAMQLFKAKPFEMVASCSNCIESCIYDNEVLRYQVRTFWSLSSEMLTFPPTWFQDFLIQNSELFKQSERALLFHSISI